MWWIDFLSSFLSISLYSCLTPTFFWLIGLSPLVAFWSDFSHQTLHSTWFSPLEFFCLIRLMLLEFSCHRLSSNYFYSTNSLSPIRSPICRPMTSIDSSQYSMLVIVGISSCISTQLTKVFSDLILNHKLSLVSSFYQCTRRRISFLDVLLLGRI